MRVLGIVLKLLRIAVGYLLMGVATAFLIQGGFSRYARNGVPPHADWRYLAMGVATLGIGSFLIRPFWWRYLSRH